MAGRAIRAVLLLAALQFAILSLASTLLATSTPATAGWIGAWSASPSETSGGRRVQNETIRQVVRLAAVGSAIRLRFSNALGAREVTLGEVSVARPVGAGAIDPATLARVTFGGQPFVVLAAGASALSDPVPWPSRMGDDLSVSLFVAGSRAGLTSHAIASATGFVAAGNATMAPTLPRAMPIASRLVLSGVDRLGEDGAATIVALGDSLTDGFRSTPNANRRWPDILSDRLRGDPALRRIGVANAGIGGNRLLRDRVGPSALARLPRDVLVVPGLRFVCVLEGINDIAAGTQPGHGRFLAAYLIAGYRQIVTQAHVARAEVFLGTIMPYRGAKGFNPAGEAVRQQVNAWIRADQGFDGVLDFDAAVRDPSAPARLLPAFDSGDHLHPNDAGYAAMGQSIPLSLFEARHVGRAD